MLLHVDRTFVEVLLIFLPVVMLPISINAQDPTINSRRTLPVVRDMRYHEWSLKNLEKKAKRRPEEQRLAWEQIREDFKSIQVIDNDLSDHRASHSALGRMRRITRPS